ncbi:suppressor of RPS4-RLD 1 isoform X2 [Magnolia sinica]|uniref:suppressor of RPS4-RLD 1 isoform X2 n=1 Tax=Magnolia sinica TaxID=86752 RepID=UPI00265901F7|nr:suppressor of RPS4-RLD 1 isoform X2 [Magnolia sinica]
MASIAERQELAKLCTSRDWSKAIRILDSLLSQSCSIQDICNRAFCYSQLELHKHVIKDCDKALQMDPTLLQAYILKGRSLSALGKKDDALLVWEQGYGNAVRQSADLKQLLELEELLAGAKQNKTIICDDHAMESSSITTSASDSGSEIHSKSINGHEIRRKSRDDLAMESSSITTSASDSGSEVHRKSTDRREIRSKSRDTAEIRNKSSNGAIINKKVFVTSTSKTKSISLDFRLSRGIAQVNDGRYDHAISIFDQILRENPTSPEALIGRGTAYAFQRELDAAIADFTKAIESNPLAGEAWKRRGQARAALGESVEAIEDLAKALEFEPNSSDILHERGIVNFKFKDYTAAVEDLSSCVMLDRDNKSAYTYLGLALSSIGEYKRAEEAHMKSIRLDPNFLEGWTHLAQFYQDLANTAKALECLQQVLLIDERCAKAYHLRGLLHHGMGKHRDAIKDLSVGLGVESSNIECLYLRASCYHAIGEYGEAVKDYDALLDLELDSMEKFVLQCLGFYQKEIALYTASKINSEFCWFDLDGDIDPLFKEYWCKRLHPKYVCEKVYRQPPLRESLKKGRLRKQDVIVTKQKATLLQAADLIGKKIQYNCKGFMPNRRQIMRAESCSDLHSGVGEDFWVATTCNSTAFEGKHLEGTRITVQKTAERGFDFAIRTPCTPSRWDDYDAEMTIAWEALCNAYCGEVYGSTDLNVLESVRDAILRMAYYWYNFMPLSRGSAAVGYVVLLGLFLAANMEVTESIPKGVQVDWEAILSPDPSVFVDSIKSWLYPSLKIKTLWKDYPDVASTFATTASIVSALSTYND